MVAACWPAFPAVFALVHNVWPLASPTSAARLYSSRCEYKQITMPKISVLLQINHLYARQFLALDTRTQFLYSKCWWDWMRLRADWCIHSKCWDSRVLETDYIGCAAVTSQLSRKPEQCDAAFRRKRFESLIIHCVHFEGHLNTSFERFGGFLFISITDWLFTQSRQRCLKLPSTASFTFYHSSFGHFFSLDLEILLDRILRQMILYSNNSRVQKDRAITNLMKGPRQ